MNRSARGGKSVKRFERSNGLDTALYKNYLYLYYYGLGVFSSQIQHNHMRSNISSKVILLLQHLVIACALIDLELWGLTGSDQYHSHKCNFSTADMSQTYSYNLYSSDPNWTRDGGRGEEFLPCHLHLYVILPDSAAILKTH